MLADLQNEKQEAIDAGEIALQSLQEAKAYLDKASGWGIVDILGGGFITSFLKHSNMNNAQECMAQAKEDLKAFSKELEDVADDIDLGFNAADFLSFADYFFDGFIADWFMQSRIQDAKAQVNEAIIKIENILEKLR